MRVECCYILITILIFSLSLPSFTLYVAAEVNLSPLPGITGVTTPFFSGPPLSPGLRMGQWMRVASLYAAARSTWIMACGRDGGEAALFHAASSGGACLSSQCTVLRHSLTPTAQTHMANSCTRFKEALSKLWRSSLFTLLFAHSPSSQKLIWLEMQRCKCGKKNTRWKDARKHPHSHTTPMLTRHQLDRFQEVWH